MSGFKTLFLAALVVFAFCQDTYPSFEEYEEMYGYQFDPEEEFYRASVYQQNVEYIRGHNNENCVTYFQDVNHFAHLTHEEFVAMYFELPLPACIIPPDDVEQCGTLPPTNPVPWNSTESLQKQSLTESNTPNASEWDPEPVDWTEIPDVLTPVKDQGSCGACYAFSSIAAVESLYFLSDGIANLDLSEQQLVDCSQSHGNLGCGGGDMMNAFNYIKEKGITNEADYPYTSDESGSCKINEGAFKISGYTEIPEGNCQALAEALAQRPISVGVDASNFQFYKNGTFQNCTMQPNHAVLLVGVSSQWWKIRNSWGADWGEDGYIRLSAINGNSTCNVCYGGVYPNK